MGLVSIAGVCVCTCVASTVPMSLAEVEGAGSGSRMDPVSPISKIKVKFGIETDTAC